MKILTAVACALLLLAAAPVSAGIVTVNYTGNWSDTGEDLTQTDVASPFGFMVWGTLGGTCAAYGTCYAEVLAERELDGGSVPPGPYQTQTIVLGGAVVGEGGTLGPITAETWLQYDGLFGGLVFVDPSLSEVSIPGGSGEFGFQDSDLSDGFDYSGSAAVLKHRFWFQVNSAADAVDVTVNLPVLASSDGYLVASAIPEPATLLTLLAGLAVLGLGRRLRRHA